MDSTPKRGDEKMSLKIHTNLMSKNAQRHLETHQKNLSHAQAALASGKRIVSPSDDAAGLSIAENLRSQVVGIQMARKNALAGQSLIQVSEGGLNEVTNLLVRIRELSMQAASDSTSKQEKGLLNQEVKQLVEEIDRIALSTQFGSRKLLDGSLKNGLEYHVGPFSSEENRINVKLNIDSRANNLNLTNLSLKSKNQARRALKIVDQATNQISEMRAGFGAVQRRLESTITNLAIQNENLSSAKSNIQDSDIAEETAKAASAQILKEAAISTLVQANHNGKSALRLFG